MRNIWERMTIGEQVTLLVLAAAACFAFLMNVIGDKVYAAEWKWELFNVAPFAETREKAMETRESAFLKAGLPKAVVALLMEETKKPGEKIRLVNGDHLSFMVSKGGVVHKDVVVAFVKPPVSGQMEYAAPAEKWSVMDGVRIFSVILPEVCNNWSGVRPAIKISADPVSPFVTKECPNGYSIIANVWSLTTMPENLRKNASDLIGVAEGRDSQEATDVSAYKGDAFSRTLGGQLRREVKIRAPIEAETIVRLRSPGAPGTVENAGVMKIISGQGSFSFSSDPRKWIIETIWPMGFLSPTISGGERRLWLFPEEWGKHCSMNEHGLVR